MQHHLSCVHMPGEIRHKRGTLLEVEATLGTTAISISQIELVKTG